MALSRRFETGEEVDPDCRGEETQMKKIGFPIVVKNYVLITNYRRLNLNVNKREPFITW